MAKKKTENKEKKEKGVTLDDLAVMIRNGFQSIEEILKPKNRVKVIESKLEIPSPR